MEAFKSLEYFVLPSGMFFALILSAALLFWVRKGRLSGILLSVAFIFYYLASITPFSDLLLYPLERPYRHPDFRRRPAQINTIVMLAGGETTDVLRAAAILRIFRRWQKAGNVKGRIILSGSDPLDPRSGELTYLRDALMEDGGIAASRIILDRRSLTTRESSLFLKPLLGKAPFFLVTSAYHMTRSLMEFRLHGMNPVPAAADFRMSPRYSFLSLLPSAENLKNTDLALHEYEGMVYYRLCKDSRFP